MKETTKQYGSKTSYIREFDSLSDFTNYIHNTPLNETFRWEELHSSNTDNWTKKFTNTQSYPEAEQLLKDGWNDGAKDITEKLKVVKNQVVNEMVKKITYDVVGFQCSVPRYLQGIPTSMVNKKLTPVKQKVITLNKDISYNCMTNTEDIVKSSVEILQVIKKIEAQGIRVNLNLIFGADGGNTTEVVKIRLKSANERLNISKLAFPLVHPSMLRRLLLRYVEVAPTVTKAYKHGYGKPLDGSRLKTYCKDEYVLPRLFDGNVAKLGDLNSICKLTDQIVNGKNDKAKI